MDKASAYRYLVNFRDKCVKYPKKDVDSVKKIYKKTPKPKNKKRHVKKTIKLPTIEIETKTESNIKIESYGELEKEDLKTFGEIRKNDNVYKNIIQNYDMVGEIITMDTMSKAIENSIGIEKEKAVEDADFLLEIFGFNDVILDKPLTKHARQLLYMLEEDGLVKTIRKEETLPTIDGYVFSSSIWRSHFWQLKKEKR